MIEEQIGEELVITDLKPHLLTDERERLPEFKQKPLYMRHQLCFEFPFGASLGHREKVEHIRILRQLLRKIRIDRRQSCREVGDRGTRAFVQSSHNLMCEGVAAPPILESSRGIPEPGFCHVEFLDKHDLVTPWQFCNALQNCAVWPHLRKGAHVSKVAGRETRRPGKHILQIGR